MLSGCYRNAVRIIPETVSGCYRNMHAFSILENRMCFLLSNSELSNKKPPLCFPLNYIKHINQRLFNNWALYVRLYKRLYLLLIKKIDIKRRKAPNIFFKSIVIVGLPIKPKWSRINAKIIWPKIIEDKVAETPILGRIKIGIAKNKNTQNTSKI